MELLKPGSSVYCSNTQARIARPRMFSTGQVCPMKNTGLTCSIVTLQMQAIMKGKHRPESGEVAVASA